MSSLLPTSANKIAQNYQTQSQQQARSMLESAKSMAGSYLQGMKEMAGGQANQPMRTMQKEQMDINNALNKVNAYTNLSGKVPNMDYLNMVGLQNTLGPIAGQPTYENQMYADKVVRSLIPSSGGPSNGNSYSGESAPNVPSTVTERVNQSKGQALDAVGKAVNLGLSYDEIYNNIYNSAGALTSEGVNIDDVIFYLDSIYPAEQREEEQMTPEEIEKKRLQARSGGQRFIDAILPGGQYR